MFESPGIVISTLPKSGTMYINARLQDILQERYQPVMAKAGRWPNICIHEPSIRYMAQNGAQFTVGHIPATEVNLADMKLFGLERIAVHVRDPRQAILSWTHWIDRSFKERELLPHETPSLPDYFESPFETRLSWQIVNQLPHLSSFLESWIQVAQSESPPVKVKLTRFTQMKHDPRTFFDELLCFFKVQNYTIPESVKLGHSKAEHFRKGLENEWKSVFSEAQKDQAWSMLGPRLIDFLRLAE